MPMDRHKQSPKPRSPHALAAATISACLWATPTLAQAWLPRVASATESAAPAEALQAPVAAPPVAQEPGIFGSTVWGTRGMRGVSSARGMPAYALSLSVGYDYYRQRSLLQTGDLGAAPTHRVAVAFAPLRGLDIAVSHQTLALAYRNVQIPRDMQVQANPSVQVKYGNDVAHGVALGARLALSWPTPAGRSGSVGEALGGHVEANLAVQPWRHLEFLANAGFCLDRAGRLYQARPADPLEQLVYQIDTSNKITWGAGVQARIAAGKHVDVVPFAAFHGAIATAGGSTRANSSVGVRIYPSSSRLVELSIGSDVRIHGDPQQNSRLAGLPMWRAFAQLSVHAPLGQRHKAAMLQASVAPAPIPTVAVADGFRVRGTVRDAQTQQAVAGPQIRLQGDGNSLLTTAQTDGAFVSWALPRDAGAIEVLVQAPGYADVTQNVQPPASGDAEINVALIRQEQKCTSVLTGSVRNAATGRAVTGTTIRCAALPKAIRIDARGNFSIAAPAGNYSLQIAAPGFVAQTQTIVVHSGEAAVLNVDLEPVSF